MSGVSDEIRQIEKVKLNNGVKIPALGIGTWQIPASEDLVNSLLSAIGLGYRYIDTAAIYENETSVAEAIRRSGIKRSELFVSSKCWAANRTYDAVMRAFEESLRNLKLEYLDCYLIHVAFHQRRTFSLAKCQHWYVARF